MSMIEVSCYFPNNIAVVGLEIIPYLELRLPDGSIADDLPKSLNGYFLRYRWYRVLFKKEIATCSIHPKKNATVQCTDCSKLKLPSELSYHCDSNCFLDSWHHHRSLHDWADKPIKEIGDRKGEPALVIIKKGGKIFLEVGRSRSYTPDADDADHVLNFECVIIDAVNGTELGVPDSVYTQWVIQPPSYVPRCMVSLHNAAGSMNALKNFTVLSYNILADALIPREKFNYCPSWALSWAYRRQRLLREILSYQADILCLQEVQCNHFDEFFAPELKKHGYHGVLKKRTNQTLHGKPDTVDGCAVFFRTDRFSLVKKYEIEFNKAARSLGNSFYTTGLSNMILNRFVNDNVALTVFLEAKFAKDNTGKKQFLCIANTHVQLQQDFQDVKLWQVHKLLRILEMIKACYDIPLLLCGDFDFLPGSAMHTLLTTGIFNEMQLDAAADPFRIFLQPLKFWHRLPLVSAYSELKRERIHEQTKCLDHTMHGPIITTCTKYMVGCVDYIFFTENLLSVESLLELLSEEKLHKEGSLPSPIRPSDHLALLAEFAFRPRN